MFTRKHSKSTKVAVKASVVAIATLFGANAFAAGAVDFQTWSGTNHLHPGNTISASNAVATPNSMTTNPALNNSAWAHTGQWFTFMNHDAGNVSVTVNGAGDFAPGFAVWASGATEFDGGTEPGFCCLSTAGFTMPHSFNVSGPLGDNGTQWMSGGLGNMAETLGYAVSNPNVNFTSGTGWGETILAGTHDVSITNVFETGVTGNTSAHSATLDFNNLAAGWYTVYVGGTDGTATTTGYDLVVSAVPEAQTWAMLVAGLGFVGWRLRNQPRKEFDMMPA
ncbi:MAG: pyruvate-binding protein [Nitrosomonas sp.]|nr:pyruvate-binding protein [Nitrosomonas sp.]